MNRNKNTIKTDTKKISQEEKEQFVKDMLSLESKGLLKIIHKDHMGISKYKIDELKYE
jgi:hypothetical protein